MFRVLVDTLKEVFWIKPSRRRPKPRGKARPIRKPAARKKPVKKTVKARPKPGPVPNRGQTPVSDGTSGLKQNRCPSPDPSLVHAGEITHYFDRIKVCVVKITHGTILIGDKLTFLGSKTKFVQKVWSMQIESVDVKVAKKGQLIGLKVDKPVTVGDRVYKGP